MENNGIYLRLKYIGPRKRLPKNWGVTGEIIEDCVMKAHEWLKENGGKFVDGYFSACYFYDIDFKGEKIRMQSMPICAPATKLEENQLNFINNKG